jgi:serine/threonine protein kinase
MSPPSSNAARRNESSVAFGTVVSSSGMSYTPIFELGEGGMGKVFLARAKGAGDFTKLVVLKAMRVGDLGNEPVAQMFANEARLSARFNHPNLVQVQEVNLSAVPPFLVMEYLDGKPLSALRSRPEVTLAMHLAILSEVLSGLHYAHELRDFDGSPLGIVHRDVSPHNVFITCDGAVKVLDFGIAKVNGVEGRTVAGEIKGKLGYMAPEQLLDGEVDRRADVFSIGSMLWEAAIGKRMWEGVPDPNLMHRLATFAIPRPSDHGRIDPELEAIILKATAGRASDRYSSAREFQQALDEYRARRSDQTSLRRVGALLAETFRSERLEREALISSALKNSLPPPPLGEAAPTAAPANDNVETPASSSRWKWVALAGLLLLAGAGFYAERALRAQEGGDALTSAHPADAPPAPSNASADTADTQTVPTREEEPTKPTSTKKPKSVSASVRPSVSASVNATGEKSAPEDEKEKAKDTGKRGAKPVKATGASCNPPYYFSAGIKMYKPECL